MVTEVNNPFTFLISSIVQHPRTFLNTFVLGEVSDILDLSCIQLMILKIQSLQHDEQ